MKIPSKWQNIILSKSDFFQQRKIQDKNRNFRFKFYGMTNSSVMNTWIFQEIFHDFHELFPLHFQFFNHKENMCSNNLFENKKKRYLSKYRQHEKKIF